MPGTPNRAAAAIPSAPGESYQRSADEDAQQYRPGSAKVATPVDRGPRQRLTVGLHDLLGAGRRKSPKPLCLPASARRERSGPHTQRPKQQCQDQ
jgi:hypothetical protein